MILTVTAKPQDDNSSHTKPQELNIDITEVENLLVSCILDKFVPFLCIAVQLVVYSSLIMCYLCILFNFLWSLLSYFCFRGLV